MSRCRGLARRVSRNFSDSTGQHLAGQTAQPIDAQPDVQPVCADLHAFDQQRNDARLLGGEELVPQRVELLQGGAGIGFGDVVGMGARRLPRPRHDLGLAKHRAQLVDDGIFSYAVEAGVIDHNPTHGLRKPKYQVRDRRLSEAEYRILGGILRQAQKSDHYRLHGEILWILAVTGCRRGEIINLRWSEIDIEGSCLRLIDSKEGASVRPIGLPVIEYLESKRSKRTGTFVFPGQGVDNAVGNFPQSWKKLLTDTPLWDVTPHVLRHSFASIATDLGFTEITIAALIGHAKGSVTSRYVHTLDSTLIMAADTVAGYLKALLDGVEFRRNTYTLDRESRRSAIEHMLIESRPAPKPKLLEYRDASR